ncbi:MAG: plastocyanin [Bacillariaceae sp.]|jgi:plastocyanin
MASSTTFLSTLVLFIAATLAFTTISAAVAEAAEIIEVENWYLPYNGPKEVTANVGDSIVFNWNTGHNVYIHPTMSCALDDIIFVGNKSPTTYTFTETDGGTDMFFGCDIGNGAHCRNGTFVK